MQFTLFFYDVGLATYLLGVENERQRARHPLRGSLFENLVVAEALKHRFNRGKRSHLHFYRDSKGNEVDLLLVKGAAFFPIEIKAGMTITGDYLKGLRYFANLFPDQIPHGSGLVYSGQDAQKRSGVTIVPIAQLPDMLERFS